MAESEDRRPTRWWETFPVVVMAVLAVGSAAAGIVVTWERQASATEDAVRRVALLETSSGETERHWVEISSKLASIGTTVDWIKEQLRISKVVNDVNDEIDKSKRPNSR